MGKKLNRKKQIVALGIIAALCIIGYNAHSHFYYQMGFPLDDSWIHQTYARNLVQLGEWSFIPEKLSAGSTSPLWTILLSPAYILNISPIFWSNFIGWILLWGIGIVSMRLFEQYIPVKRDYSLWIGIGMICEWHLVWAACSGMETELIALLILINCLDLKKKSHHWIINGLLIGISIWVRPDGIVLLLPVALIIWSKESDIKSKMLALLSCMAGVFLFFVPYLGFNKYLSGDWWPNTFYAKQTEYAIMRGTPIVIRYLREFSLALVGVGALLFPGFILYIFNTFRNRKWDHLAPLVMFLFYVGIYAWRLPVTYQHGRYIIPVMPLFFITGMIGIANYYEASIKRMITRVLFKSWIISSIIVTIGFLIMGAQAFGRDVGLIQSEMVTTAKWIEKNTKANAVIAAHDIGAMGYWSNRNIIDLAGLISPEVIPFIRDEHKIQQYLDNHQVDYLVTFPGWYPYLSTLGQKVFQTNGKIAILLGGENMVIYRWNSQP